MTNRQKLVAGVLIVLAGSVACDGYYRKATVIKIAAIIPPENLSDAAECRELWGDIARYGVEMDNGRKDWNQVVLNAATFLIEKGCVKKPRAEAK